MGHRIPVIFFPVGEAEIPSRLETWADVSVLVGQKRDQRPDSGYREAASLNWWHQNALWRLAVALADVDLGFLVDEVTCLGPETLASAARAIEQVLLMADKGLPRLGVYEHTDLDILRQPGADAAAGTALAEPWIESRDSGFGAVSDFYSFLKSLAAAIDECLSTHRRLMYIQMDYKAHHSHA